MVLKVTEHVFASGISYVLIDLSSTEPVVSKLLVSFLFDLRCSEVCNDDDGDDDDDDDDDCDEII
jgi:hypothetical protein